MAQYVLTPGDRELFALAKQDVNIFTDFYFRSPDTGTWWNPDEPDPERLAGYESLLNLWKSANRPNQFALRDQDSGTEIIYQVRPDIDPDQPRFFHNHGFLWLPWQSAVHHAPQKDRTIVGGYGCLAPETRVFDVLLGYVPIQELADMGRRPIVLSKLPVGWAIQAATVPFIKGEAPYFRVNTFYGRSFRVTGDHVFLTARGYVKACELVKWDLLIAVPYNSETLHLKQYVSHSDYEIASPDFLPGPEIWHQAHPDAVTSVSPDGHGLYYDMHVPNFENYVAEGLVHHNTGKTVAMVMDLAINAVTHDNFLGAFVAPYSYQANHAFESLVSLMEGTPFEERFVTKVLRRPPSEIHFEHNGIGRSTIRFYSLNDDQSKLLSTEFDQIVVDQAEYFDPLSEKILNPLGSRLRGRTSRGRQRMNILTLIANSNDNPELWDRFDDAEFDPEHMLSMSVSTYDNIWLTKTQIEDFERRFADDETQRSIHMLGERPPGSGEHFPAHIVQKCRDDQLIKDAREGTELSLDGYEYGEARKVGIYKYRLPPEPGHEYLQVSDPGWADPPNRNSAAIMVWDVTHFPVVPARLVAFEWVFGGNSPRPWIAKYMELLRFYRADQYLMDELTNLTARPGHNGFDATGQQSGYDVLVFSEYGIVPEKFSLTGTKKYDSLNAAKVLMSRGMLSFPYIQHLWMQMQKYVLPDDKLRQDLVMTLAMSANWLVRKYGIFSSSRENIPAAGTTTVPDRHARPTSAARRHKRLVRSTR